MTQKNPSELFHPLLCVYVPFFLFSFASSLPNFSTFHDFLSNLCGHPSHDVQGQEGAKKIQKNDSN